MIFRNPKYGPKLIFTRNGMGMITGTVADVVQTEGLVSHEVKLFEQTSNLYLKSVYTGEDGRYKISTLDENKRYFIVSHYIDDSKNGEMADNIVPQRDPIYDHIIS